VKTSSNCFAGLLCLLPGVFLLAGCAADFSNRPGDDWDRRWDARNDHGVDPMTVRVTSPELQFPQLLGQDVLIHLRRDALGMGGGTSPVGLNTDGPGRNALALRGIYRGQDGAWVRLEREGGTTLFLPIDLILAVEAATQQETLQPPEARQ
jgi:hypothetical protein